MESGVPHAGRLIRTKGHVLRIDQLPGDVSNDDEHYILKGSG